jgi:hypothetical protein
MLKYKPKEFWGMLKPAPQNNTRMTAATFAAYNKSIFYDSTIPEDIYKPI